MSSGRSNAPVSFLDYSQPPAGLPKEWENVYHALNDQVFVAAAFYTHPNVHEQNLESLKAWYDGFRLVKANAQAVMPYLLGRAPITWRVGKAIETAIFPICANLGSVV